MTKARSSKRDLIHETREAAQVRRRARLDALVALVQQRMIDVVADFWDIGRALGEIVDDKLYLAAGHESFGAFLRAERLPSRAQAAKLIAIARAMPREKAIELGPEKTYALLSYTRATPEVDGPVDVITAGTLFEGKTAAEASVRAIEESARAQREKAASRSPAKRARAKEDEALRKAIARRLAAAGLRGATVTVRGKVVRAEWPRETAAKRVDE